MLLELHLGLNQVAERLEWRREGHSERVVLWGADTLESSKFDWSERSVVVARCDWGDGSGEPDQKMACKPRNLNFILKAK